MAYFDEDNLYELSSCRPLSHSEFSWLPDSELEHFAKKPDEILKFDDEGDYGCLFEVDLKYPRELHASTADFPLAPESNFIS